MTSVTDTQQADVELVNPHPSKATACARTDRTATLLQIFITPIVSFCKVWALIVRLLTVIIYVLKSIIPS